MIDCIPGPYIGARNEKGGLPLIRVAINGCRSPRVSEGDTFQVWRTALAYARACALILENKDAGGGVVKARLEKRAAYGDRYDDRLVPGTLQVGR